MEGGRLTLLAMVLRLLEVEVLRGLEVKRYVLFLRKSRGSCRRTGFEVVSLIGLTLEVEGRKDSIFDSLRQR